MNLTLTLPAYCERLGAGLSGEPLNAISNLAFVIAALAGWRAWKRAGGDDRAALALVVAAALIGAGSLAWHTARSPATLMMDVIPIQLFVFGYFALALRRFFNQSAVQIGLWLTAFLAATLLFRRVVPASALAGGANYIPALAALYLMGAILVLRARAGLYGDIRLTGEAAARSDARHFPGLRTGYALLLAGLVFALSLAARTLDLPLCASVPIGLHFLWHILNAITIGLLLTAAIRHGAARSRA